MNVESKDQTKDQTVIPEEALERIEEEKDSLARTLTNLMSAESSTLSNLRKNSELARDLTSQIVDTRRESEKQMLASDEAVSHALSTKNRSSLDDIKKLKNKNCKT